jgi:hypothetical protein
MRDLPMLAGRVFRTGSTYDLVVFDRLPVEEQIALSDLRADPDIYGVLRPREGSGRTYRAIGKDAALLVLTLREPGPLPFFVFSDDPARAGKAISDLVLDGVLEIEDRGRFVSGPAAAALFVLENTETVEGHIAKLSREAMLYAQALELDDPERLAGRLYAYGRCPVTAELARRLQDHNDTLAWLGADPGSGLRRILDSDWHFSGEADSPGWLAWSKSGKQGRRLSTAPYKMYISPHVKDVPKAFASVVERLGRRDGGQFKIGKGAEGVTRPDKLVAYFESLESLLESADDLTGALAGVRAHGVPFSAGISGDGLLSWGMDPPLSYRTFAWQGPESWRNWVVRRLANAIVAAQRAESSVPAWQFAVERLRREGVDTDRWTPSASIWNAA